MFADCTPAVAENSPGRLLGVSAVAFDGGVAFFVCGFAGACRLLAWTGAKLVDVIPPVLANPGGKSVAAVAADFDGDGRDELFLASADGDRVFGRGPDGQWAPLSGAWDAAAGPVVRAAAAIDRRGTGRYGFLAAAAGRPLRLVELPPDGRVVDLAPPLGIDRGTSGRGVLVGPLASAGGDVFLAGSPGPNVLLRNTGVGTFLEVAAEHGLADGDEAGRGGAFADGGGGKLSLCAANGDGPHRLFARRPGGLFKDVASPALAFPSAARCVVAADFDNDGYEELFFHNFGEPNRLFRLGPGGPELLDCGAAAEPGEPGTGACAADADGDGRLELLLAHTGETARPVTLYKAARTGNAWLRVRPLTRFGGPARGAVVTLVAGGRLQVRVVCGGGTLTQGEPVAHFGLGRDPIIDTVTVRWPDGVTATLDAPAPLRTLDVPYPGG